MAIVKKFKVVPNLPDRLKPLLKIAIEYVVGLEL